MANILNPFGTVPFTSVFDPKNFDDSIQYAGQNMVWMKGHECPCVGDTGSPSGEVLPQCPVCFGFGTYWDNPQGPFTVLLTMMSWVSRTVTIGQEIDPEYGNIVSGDPVLTIPFTYSPVFWEFATTNDAVVEVDAIMRFNATLRVGQNTFIPYQYLPSFSVAPSGAVVVWDPVRNTPVSGVAYTVNGTSVTLNDTTRWPTGTAYTVDYMASPFYVLFKHMGGLSHRRPFGQGGNYPVRVRIQILDIWANRNKMGSSKNIPGAG